MPTLRSFLNKHRLHIFTATSALLVAAIIPSFLFQYDVAAALADGTAANANNADEDRATQGWDSSALAGYTADGVIGADVSPITPAFCRYSITSMENSLILSGLESGSWSNAI